MPKNKGKGGKNNRRGKKEDGENKRELIFKEDGQEYAQVVKMLGNGRLEAKCLDGETRLAQIRGQMRKKVWIVVGDIILLSLRDFQDDRADVIHKYTADEARNLKTYGELKDFTLVENAEAGSDEEEEGIEFEEADIDDICEYNYSMDSSHVHFYYQTSMLTTLIVPENTQSRLTTPFVRAVYPHYLVTYHAHVSFLKSSPCLPPYHG
ncbi:translation initiation factor eIF-1A [Kwoniella pini CBS 10737]|uniref:Translation initiation factor eIF-1A n=1 Tax=Kwoniella pini CBS 10737 TaxID=1296096 RepID=A0A1B9I6D6_9TREE|nr:translation initiation factor eIF-1A [Kwoniella pini CBS 10737]OCF51084.1 translation initiation factor eIF-1A [Kwoniella pini CBS 10737]